MTADSSTSTAKLQKQLSDPASKIIITTIQKLAIFIKKNKTHEIYNKEVVIIFDECHRSQFGDMHQAITKTFKKYYIFGFTGTPIQAANREGISSNNLLTPTTAQTFGDELHSYTIVDAINDNNVLPFRVDYHDTIKAREDIKDEKVRDIDRKGALEAPERISKISNYILEHFNQKTYRGEKTYVYKDSYLSGFNSIFAVASIKMAQLYYNELKKLMAENPAKSLKIAVIYSYAPNNPEDPEGIPDEENSEDTSQLSGSERDFLDRAIQDYNKIFNTNFDTSGEKFQNYYKDVSYRMKNRELDLLIVVNMFLTGFDATTLNTLWVDKNLKMHGLIQAFSRTNRILNSIKTFGNIVCFRSLEKEVEQAVSIFGNKQQGGLILLKGFNDYYFGYDDKDKGKHFDGYCELIEKLMQDFPINKTQIIGEDSQKEFIKLFGRILKMRNLLASFDEFEGKEIIDPRVFQDYTGRYQDLHDEWKKHSSETHSKDITNDVVFEIELVKQIEVNIDYILSMVEQYREKNGQDKEVMGANIMRAIDASPSLRSKRQLIEKLIAQINIEWNDFVDQKREEDLDRIISDEKLKVKETRKFIEKSFDAGEIPECGTGINEILPPISILSPERKEKKQNVIRKLKLFFDIFWGIGRKFLA